MTAHVSSILKNSQFLFAASEEHRIYQPTGFMTAMAHALGCAADIVGRHDLYEAPGGVVLRVRAAAVAGDLFFAQAGVPDEFVFMLTGACLLDIEAMLGRALPGQIAASPALRAAFTSVPELSSAQKTPAVQAPAEAAPAITSAILKPTRSIPHSRHDRSRASRVQ